MYISALRIYARVSFSNERYSRGGYSVPLEYLEMKGERIQREKARVNRNRKRKDVRSDYGNIKNPFFFFLIKKKEKKKQFADHAFEYIYI